MECATANPETNATATTTTTTKTKKRTRAEAELKSDATELQQRSQLPPLPFDGSFLSGSGSRKSLRAEAVLSEWESTDEGINIIGGFALLSIPGRRPERVFIKKMKRDHVVAAVAVDVIRQHRVFDGMEPIGTHYARVIFSEPVTIKRPLGMGRGDITISSSKSKSKTGNWFYISRRIATGESMCKHVECNYNFRSAKLYIPQAAPLGERGAIEDLRAERLAEKLAQAFAFRMIVGVTDPGPGNFLIERSSGTIYSVDEGSAFSPKLAPPEMNRGKEKAWLTANLAGKGAISQLALMTDYVRKVHAKWWTRIPDKESLCVAIQAALSHVAHLDDERRQRYSRYIIDNLKSFPQDWETLVGKQE